MRVLTRIFHKRSKRKAERRDECKAQAKNTRKHSLHYVTEVFLARTQQAREFQPCSRRVYEIFGLKHKIFAQWAKTEMLIDFQLMQVMKEIKDGLVGVRLGGSLYKKRIAIFNQGKNGGARSILAYQEDSRAIFLYGFCKNQEENINEKELVYSFS